MIRAAVRFAIDRPVVLNLVFWIVVLAGIVGWVRLPKEEFPQVDTDRVIVIASYPGATPSDVEDLLIRPIEDAVDGVEGLKHVYSDAVESLALVSLEFARGTDANTARDEVEREVSAIDNLPEDASTPRVIVAALKIPLVHVALTGDVNAIELAESLSDEIMTLPMVKAVEIRGASERVIRVDLFAEQLAARGISPADVARAIEAAGVGAPAGEVTVGSQQVMVRTRKGVDSVQDLARVPLAVVGGTSLTVGDVGRIASRWEAPEVTHFVSGQPAIVLVVRGQSGGDALVSVDAIREWTTRRRATLPPGIGLVAYDDSARMVRHRIRILAQNGLVGAVLVTMVLIAFIGFRNTALVLWGMPVAYCGAVVMMGWFGVSVNVISSFALLLVTGIIVDDAVVIVENVQRHLEMGKDRVLAALDGTSEVFGAVLASTLTTCLAFAPLMMLEGTVGRVLSVVPMVVIFALSASLLEAFWVLPGHLGHYAREREAGEAHETWATRWVKAVYAPVVGAVTGRWARYGALIVLLVGFISILGLTQFMRTTLTTPGKPVFTFVNVDLPPGADPAQTRAATQRIEALANTEAKSLVLYISSRIGEQTDQRAMSTLGPRFGQVKIGFVNSEEVLAQVPAFLETLRRHLMQDRALDGFGLELMVGGPPSGRDIDVRVRSLDADDAVVVARALEAHLLSRQGVFDVRNEGLSTMETFDVQVDSVEAARFGVREAQVSSLVRAAMDGVLALQLPLRDRTTEVRVGLAGYDNAGLQDVADIPLQGSDGRMVRLRQVAQVSRATTPSRIQRVDRQRAVRVSALVDVDRSTPEAEVAGVEEAFAASSVGHEGASLFYGGEIADSAESFAELPRVFFFAVLMIYGVLAIQFRSYIQPFIILAAVPLGMSGVIIGLFVLQMDLSFIAMIGAVGLAGIVVNDSLVLIEFINIRREVGLPPREAVVEASLIRLRPILITTVTTVLGLLPIAMGVAGEEPLLAPMAVSISFGLAFATALTLVAVPVLYLVLEDLASLFRRPGSGASGLQGSGDLRSF